MWYLCMYVYGTKLNPCNFLFKNSGGVSGGGSYGGGSGSFSLDIDVLDQSVNQNTQIGQSLTEFTIGSESVPLPIHTKVVPIFEALVDNLWDASERTSIRQKKTHLRTALQSYASYKRAVIAQGSCSIIHDYWCVCVCVCVCGGLGGENGGGNAYIGYSICHKHNYVHLPLLLVQMQFHMH